MKTYLLGRISYINLLLCVAVPKSYISISVASNSNISITFYSANEVAFNFGVYIRYNDLTYLCVSHIFDYMKRFNMILILVVRGGVKLITINICNNYFKDLITFSYQFSRSTRKAFALVFHHHVTVVAFFLKLRASHTHFRQLLFQFNFAFK